MTTPSPQCPQCLRNISTKHSPFRDQAVCANRNCTLFLQRLNQQYPRDYFKAPRGNSLEEQILDRRAQLQAYQYRYATLKHAANREFRTGRIQRLGLQIAEVNLQIEALKGQETAHKTYAAYRRSY